MQIILLDKVVNLGNLGEIVKVKDGYARNFLIPSGRARRATAAAKQEFEAKRAELEKAAAAKLAESQALGEKLAGSVCKLTQKAMIRALQREHPPFDGQFVAHGDACFSGTGGKMAAEPVGLLRGEGEGFALGGIGRHGERDAAIKARHAERDAARASGFSQNQFHRRGSGEDMLGHCRFPVPKALT